MTARGHVSLVGAGPGDPRLITVGGLEALGQAEVVVYDHLVSPRLLDRAPSGARRIYVGKEQGRHAMSQAAINRLLIRWAKAGKPVVRLKGGDPWLFGRGGEEALALAEAGVAYEVIPGVTSALAVPAYAGIPVTHRDLSSSVVIVTGHEDPSKRERAVHWERLAGVTDTLVCLMGLTRLPATVAALLTHGRAATTPCAVIEWGTFAQQRTATGTLATIVARCRAQRIRPPAVIVVGEVVRLRARLNWFETRPLFGARIVVTRPADRAEALTQLLERAGAAVEELPAIQLAPIKLNGAYHNTLGRLDRFDWVFFTSPEGIEWFQRILAARQRDVRVLHGRHIGAIGPKTAASIRKLGIHVDFTPASFSQEGMLEGLRRRQLAGKRAIIFNAAGSRDVLERGLAALGMDVRRVPIYQTVVPTTLITRARIVFREPVDFITVTSASCVQHVTAALRAAGLSRLIKRLRFASIGPVTSRAVREAGGRVAVEATTSTIEGLAEAIVAATRAPRQRQRR